ncbi:MULTISPECIES: peroxiredoxin-like family protein [unclassified Pseudofrankia]|uniref:peroxiredoxin-like family protein n=1 Tax=unclassified Pseudofrankia TaxID=2994372 RepID=UPI0008D952E8|nr:MULTISPECIES: peroxiredoxin-like family protein [unclassified Pseudofrankia]MDT3445661.1 peroxiredoxin-like family protein [Pseudofrankia sp. BMG5.37]OHV45395.1 alkyl hydroperoxide reductase [Pseudofrankia sp. BMG5.36]
MYTPRNPVRPGDVVAVRELVPVAGPPIPVPDPAGRLVHLQFRRFAGCPICNLHLRSVARRVAEIEGAGVREVVVFHSPAAELARYADELPLTLIADPDRRLYVEFGVESAARALLDPRAWGAVIGGVARSTWAVLRGRDRPPARRQPHGRLGLPGDFLIAPDGKVLAAKYGEHAYDQWSVDELLVLAAAPRELASAG